MKFFWRFVAGSGDSLFATLKCLLPLLVGGAMISGKGKRLNWQLPAEVRDILGNSTSVQYDFESVNLS